jgi:peroxiredoxin
VIEVGSQVPDVTVWTTPFESASFREIVADGPILLLFYLFDWSSTCTNEVQLLQDRSDELKAAGVRPYAISRDSPWTHIAWMQALDLTVPLLSDWNGEATRGFDVAIEFRGLRDVSQRSAFLVDGDGVIRAAWAYDTSDPAPDFEAILDAVRVAL